MPFLPKWCIVVAEGHAMTYPKICQQCGIQFAANKKTRMFCSYACSGASKSKALPSVVCAGCGHAFQVKRADRIDAAIYCSHPCYLKHNPRRTLTEKICIHCGKAFTNRNSACCSNDCRAASRRTRLLQACKACGKAFEAAPAILKKGAGKFCSAPCVRSFQVQQRIKTICAMCHCAFEVCSSELHYRKPKFCSIKCRTQAAPRTRIKLRCENCGESFEERPGRLNDRTPRFCSRRCFRTFGGESVLEQTVRIALEGMGMKFTQEHPLGKFYLDFFLPELNVDLEADGDFWHRDKDRDSRRDQKVAEHGIRTVRVKASEVFRSSDVQGLIAARIEAMSTEPLPPSLSSPTPCARSGS
jgi:very-short-patch-repair endonuclease